MVCVFLTATYTTSFNGVENTYTILPGDINSVLSPLYNLAVLGLFIYAIIKYRRLKNGSVESNQQQPQVQQAAPEQPVQPQVQQVVPEQPVQPQVQQAAPEQPVQPQVQQVVPEQPVQPQAQQAAPEQLSDETQNQ